LAVFQVKPAPYKWSGIDFNGTLTPMTQAMKLRLRFSLLLLFVLGVSVLLSLASNLANSTRQAAPPLLVSSTFLRGKPLSPINAHGLLKLLTVFAPEQHHLEKNAILMTYAQKGLTMQQHQQSPYALLLTSYLETNVSKRENLRNQASALIPKHHALHTIITALKLP
jgi:hypothetical protein